MRRLEFVGHALRDPTSRALVVVFLFMSAFYLWRAAASTPLALHGWSAAQYNALADAFLHLHLWIAHIPAALLGPEPLNLAHKPAALASYGEDSLYGEHVYIAWGPAPVIVLLVPLHLLGYEPSNSVIIAPFAIAGLGFALAALRVTLRLVVGVPIWMSALAALTLACASVVPELMKAPAVYQEAIAGGYCFTMAGVWLAASAVADRRASLARLALMSLCFGLATGSRPTLALTGLILVPVYAALRSTRPRRELLVGLVVPLGAVWMLFAVYNYARFGSPLEVGEHYVINEGHKYLSELSFLPVALWSYLLAPPRVSLVFPFLSTITPLLSYPLKAPAHFAPEATGGLLPLTPIAAFVVGLPIVWRYRPGLLGRLGPLLLTVAGVGVAVLFFMSFTLPATTERYATDYTTLVLLGALAVWLALSVRLRGGRRRLMRLGGGLLAAWSCAAGLAISSNGLEGHRETWRALVDVTSPLSTALVAVVDRPILADVYSPWIVGTPEKYALATSVSTFWLSAGGSAYLTIVSPDSREVTLEANVSAGPALDASAILEARVNGPGSSQHVYRLPPGGGNVRIVTHVTSGVNHLALSPMSVAKDAPSSEVPALGSALEFPLMIVSGLHLVDG